MTIISLSGWAKSGKTRAAQILVEELGYKQMKFASPLKRIVERVTDIPEGSIEGKKDAVIDMCIPVEAMAIEIMVELGITRWAAEQRISEPSLFKTTIPVLGVTPEQMLNDLEDITEMNSFGMTYRQMLQKLGTDVMRNKWNENIHVLLAEKMVDVVKGKNLVFDDVRFPNEQALLKKLGAKTYWLHRPALVPDDFHSSETSMGESDCDEVLLFREGELLDEDVRRKFG